jgi:hypothetical protein
MAKLVVLYGAKTERILNLDIPEIVIGRGAEAKLVVDNPVSSRTHCRIRLVGDRHLLEDLGSKSGTFVNGQRIETKYLEDGDNIELGKHTIRYERGTVAPGANVADASSDAFWTGGLSQGRVDTSQAEGEVVTENASWVGDLSSNKSASAFQGTMMASGDEMKRVREALMAQQSPHLAVVIKGTRETIKLERFPFEVGFHPDAHYKLPGSRFLGKKQFAIKKIGDNYEVEALSFWAKVTLQGKKVKREKLANGQTIEAAGLKFRVGGL